MAARYWVGGAATWDATAGSKWSTTSGGAGGAAVPLVSDAVYFDAASGAVTVTIASAMAAQSLNCAGFTGTLTGGVLLVKASSALSTGGTYSGLQLKWAGNGTLATAGKSIAALDVAGDLTVAGTLAVTGPLTMEGGGLTLPHSTTHSIGSLATTTTSSKTLKSTSAGIAATLTATSGTPVLSYLSVQDIAATGGVVWRADPATCTDAGGNTGWDFSPIGALAHLFLCDF